MNNCAWRKSGKCVWYSQAEGNKTEAADNEALSETVPKECQKLRLSERRMKRNLWYDARNKEIWRTEIENPLHEIFGGETIMNRSFGQMVHMYRKTLCNRKIEQARIAYCGKWVACRNTDKGVDPIWWNGLMSWQERVWWRWSGKKSPAWLIRKVIGLDSHRNNPMDSI